MKLMDYGVLRQLLYSGSVAALALGSILVALAMYVPLAEPTLSPPSKPASATSFTKVTKENVQRRLSLETVQPHWDKRLRGPAIVPPPPAPEPTVVREEAPQPAPIKFEGKLVGTLVDDGRSLKRAWLQWGTTTPQVVSEGQKLQDQPGSPEIVSIATDEVTVQLGEAVIVLQLERNYPGLNELPFDNKQ